MLTNTRGTPPAAQALPAFHLTEQRQHGPQSVWKLCYPGAVGSQVLVGIPYLAQLRDHPTLRERSRVWPFETGFQLAPRTARDWTILHAEVYPSIVPIVPAAGECKDRAQVRTLAHHFANDDERGMLHQRFTTPIQLTNEELTHITQEEGWILGIP
jgi:precorrin-8X/cobalt-precorrin-8 methylmutase